MFVQFDIEFLIKFVDQILKHVFRLIAISQESIVNKKVGNVEGSTKIHAAAKKGDIKMLLSLVEQDADLNSKVLQGYTPLMDAINYSK